MSGNRRSRRFSKGVGHFERRFQREGMSPTYHCWYQSSRVIAFSCGIKISAVRHLVLSQSTDGQTDRQTEGRTCRIMTPKTALAYARAVKIVNVSMSVESHEFVDEGYNFVLIDNVCKRS